MEQKMDWLEAIVNDGIQMPWVIWREGGIERGGEWEKLTDPWKQFDDHTGGWWDTDLETTDPEEKSAELLDKLEGCTPEQLEAITTLLYLAIKTTRTICEL